MMPLLFLVFLQVAMGGLFDEFGLPPLGVLGALILVAAIIALPFARRLRATPASRSDLLVELPAIGILVLAAMYRREMRRADATGGADEAFAAELAGLRQALTVRPPAPTPCASCGRTPGPLSLFTRFPKEA